MILNWVLILFVCAQTVVSDTEIVNFSSELHSTDPVHFIPTGWPILSQQNNSRTLNVNPSRRGLDDCESVTTLQGNDETCLNQEGDLWIVLDLDDWLPKDKETGQESHQQKFTVRISWPASTPADFNIALFPIIPHPNLFARDSKTVRPPIPPRAEGVIYDVDQHRTQFQETVASRRMFARIRASKARFVRSPQVDGAVFPFQFLLLPEWVFPAPLPSTAETESWAEEVAFNVILEPLVMGALPESIIPGVLLLVFILLVTGVFVLPIVSAELSKLASRARKGKGKVE